MGAHSDGCICHAACAATATYIKANNVQRQWHISVNLCQYVSYLFIYLLISTLQSPRRALCKGTSTVNTHKDENTLAPNQTSISVERCKWTQEINKIPYKSKEVTITFQIEKKKRSNEQKSNFSSTATVLWRIKTIDKWLFSRKKRKKKKRKKLDISATVL